MVGKSLWETETVIRAVINYKESLESRKVIISTDQLTDVSQTSKRSKLGRYTKDKRPFSKNYNEIADLFSIIDHHLD